MEREDDSPFDLFAVIQGNRERLEKQFVSAAAGGSRWLIECRDLSDAFDSDGGVYFVECVDEAAVDAVVARCTADNPYDRLLGIFDLRRPLAEQGAGMSRAAWIAARSQMPAELGLSGVESFGVGHVTCDATGVAYTSPGGVAVRMEWAELQAVEIVITDAGPFAEDVFWVLHGDGYSLTVPQSADGSGALLARLQELPGFDNQTVIAAMSSVGSQRFLCWSRA